jgi:N-acetylmuramoyl-L-alanine amidase
MCTGSKNGKHYTNNINRIILLFIALISIIISASAPVKPAKDGWIIVIDPGHGGRDPGAIGSNSYEKNITLPVSLKAGEYIEKNIPNVKVIYTRKTDIYLDLNERAEIANRYKADLFICIHANSYKSKNSYGTETYIMGHSKDEQNLEVAMKENEVMMLDKDYSTKYEGFDPKSPESYIMFTLMQSAYAEQSTLLASKIQDQFKNNVGRYDRGVNQAGFWVLWKTTMPSVLTEIGFISNPAEEKYLNSKEGQNNIASAIYRACRDYINETDKKSIVQTARVEEPVDSISKPGGKRGTIIYMVQVATSIKKLEVKPENFNNLKDIKELQTGNRYRYASGKFDEYSKAVSYRKQIERMYPDAFVIAVKDNKILPLQEALDINKGK